MFEGKRMRGKIVHSSIVYTAGQDSAGEGWLGAPLRVRS